MPLWRGCRQACESNGIKTFRQGEVRHFNRAHLVRSLALQPGDSRRVKTELQHIRITGEELTAEKGRNWYEFTACGPGLNSLSWPPDFHQDSQGVFGKQCNE